jgi:hypothetical protein
MQNLQGVLGTLDELAEQIRATYRAAADRYEELDKASSLVR